MEQPLTDIGWFECKPDDPEIVRQRAYLAANNGIQGIEILTAGEIDRAVNLFHRDGFVLVENILNDEQIDFLARGCNEVIRQIVALDETYAGNRGSHRYSFGGSSLTRSQLHRPEWQMLLELDPVHEFISAFFGSSHYTHCERRAAISAYPVRLTISVSIATLETGLMASRRRLAPFTIRSEKSRFVIYRRHTFALIFCLRL